jgi:hypothetical protein
MKEWLVTDEVKMGQIEVHETNTVMAKTVPAELELDGGTDIALKVRVLCPSKCNLQGGKIRVLDDEGSVVKEIELTDFDGTGSETDEFLVKAPIKPGAQMRIAMFPAQEKEGVLHGESSAPFSFIVKPHATSMAVWDAPFPTVCNTKVKLKVGVRCSAECKLTGKEVEIYDHEGVKVATGTLGGVPWSDTTGLYWAEVEFKAPNIEEVYSWEVKFPKPDLEIPHEGAVYSLVFRTAKPPEHVVTIEAINKETRAPLENATVFLHSSGTTYRNQTDEGGVAKVSVPKGQYELDVLMRDYKSFRTIADVDGDAIVRAELLFWPDDNSLKIRKPGSGVEPLIFAYTVEQVR